MNIKFFEYHKLEYFDKQKCFNFLKNEKNNTKSLAHINMWDDDWETKSNTLPYILEKKDRFSIKGQFLFLEINDEIIACSGVYKSDFNDDICLAGVRMWVTSKYRNLNIPRNYLLKENKKWAVKNNAKIIALSFNDYNKNLISALKRNRLGEKNNRINTRTKEFLFHNGLEEVDFPVNIQNTKQWVVYEKIDIEYNFDWKSIEFK